MPMIHEPRLERYALTLIRGDGAERADHDRLSPGASGSGRASALVARSHGSLDHYGRGRPVRPGDILIVPPHPVPARPRRSGNWLFAAEVLALVIVLALFLILI